jgi:hypothetical protein
MNTKPMIFTAENIRGIRNGCKTMTRRLVTAQNSLLDGWPMVMAIWRQLDWKQARIDRGPSPAGNPGPYFHVPCPPHGTVHRIYPKYHADDLIWTRETWRELGSLQREDGKIPTNLRPDEIIYYADDPCALENGPWRPSIFLPKNLSRNTMRINQVRGEWLQEIEERDVRAEGCELREFWMFGSDQIGRDKTARMVFESLWDRVNGKRAPWADNPPVWVISWDRLWFENVDTVMKELAE